jgi:hypothetical protein
VSSKPAIPPQPAEYRYLNALKWIRCVAGMHYFGGAFDPEHMRGLANMAADAMAGRELPDWDESMAKSEKRARKWADEMQKILDEDREGDD